MKGYFFIGALIATCFAGTAVASPRCSHALAMKAEEATDHIKTWPQLYEFYQSYQVCDEGAIAEGVDDIVENFLQKKWSSAASFSHTLNDDPAFVRFVVRHIDEDWDVEALRTVRSRAQKQCPRGLQSFCSAVADAATETLKP